MQFVIVASMRTGSHYLVDQMNAQPDIFCHGEILNDNGLFARWPKSMPRSRADIKRELLDLRERDRHQLFSRVADLDRSKPHIGFKVLLTQRFVDEVIEIKTLKKVVLFRSNVLAQFASYKEAVARKAWNPKQMAIAERIVVEFDEHEFAKHHNRYVKLYANALERLASTRQPYFLVRHDELNNPNVVSGILSFLGADVSVSKVPKHDVRGSSDVVSRFTNPDEVLSFLSREKRMGWAFETNSMFDKILAPIEIATSR